MVLEHLCCKYIVIRKFNKVVALKLLTTFEDIIGNKLELEKNSFSWIYSMLKTYSNHLYVTLIAIDVAVFLCSGNDSSILAVTEGCQLSIWDLRMKENGGCVHRIYGSVGDIFYAVCSSSTSIAVEGADCTVTVYDPRRDRCLGIVSSPNAS
ncbi:hypothetical protein CsSME_00016073 [Camellia sinensis var. sinensis]